MIIIIALSVGAVLSFALVCFARTKTLEEELSIYAFGLLAAAFLYLVFGVFGGASGYGLALETLGVLFYGSWAWIGLRRHRPLLALGWMAHVAWDVLLHLTGEGAEYTPVWYPWLCVSFDLVIAVAAYSLVKGDAGKLHNTA